MAWMMGSSRAGLAADACAALVRLWRLVWGGSVWVVELKEVVMVMVEAVEEVVGRHG